MSIIGPSGSGKSTLLRPQRGSVTVDGLRVDRLAGEAETIALRKRIGFVFQQYNLFPHLCVLDNLTAAPVRVLGRARQDAEANARALLEKVGLADKARAYPGQLSGGQQQRVAIARALAMRPELILFDEVTAALDPETVGEVRNVIGGLVDEGLTCVLVTHEMAFARAVGTPRGAAGDAHAVACHLQQHRLHGLAGSAQGRPTRSAFTSPPPPRIIPPHDDGALPG